MDDGGILPIEPIAPKSCAQIRHPSQRITDTAEGGCELAFEIPVSGEIEAWILSWAGDCEVLAPPRLRKRIQERHQR